MRSSVGGVVLDLGFDGSALQSVLDSLSEQVAVIDVSGKIMMVNEAWQQAGFAGGLPPATRFIGVNSLDICRAASYEGLADAQGSYQGLRNVLDGVSASFSTDLPASPRRASAGF